MKVLVTGAAGFIGRHLVRQLAREHGVHGLDIVSMDDLPPLVERWSVDITNTPEMAALASELVADKIDACVHLAAIASPPIAQRDPMRAWATNVLGTYNVLQLIYKARIPRVVFFSSAHVYGISPKYLPTDESHPLALHDMYTTTKILGEELCRLFYANHGVSYCTLRLWNAYGPGQSSDYFIGAKINQAKTGRLTIRNATVTKDWVHITDVVRATELALGSAYVGPLNIGTGIETNLQAIVNQISTAFDVPVVSENVPDEGPTRMCADWRRAETTLGWAPQVPVAAGLSELLGRRVALG